MSDCDPAHDVPFPCELPEIMSATADQMPVQSLGDRRVVVGPPGTILKQMDSSEIPPQRSQIANGCRRKSSSSSGFRVIAASTLLIGTATLLVVQIPENAELRPWFDAVHVRDSQANEVEYALAMATKARLAQFERGLPAAAPAQKEPKEDVRPAQPKSEPVANPSESIAIKLSPGEPNGPLAPGYSPYGMQAPLTKVESTLPGLDHLSGSYRFGPSRTSVPLIVARSEKSKPYDRLYIDADGDGEPDKKPIQIKPNENRGKTWSSFETELKINHAPKGSPSAPESYPVSLWIVVEKQDETPTVIRLSRRGYLTGEAVLGGKKFNVILSDGNNDAVLGAGDWWELVPEKSGSKNASRNVGDFHWANGKAWKLEVEGPSGRQAKLTEFNPGMTEKEDLVMRDRLREDRQAARAAKPVPFRTDVDAAIKEVVQKKMIHFLKFETTWCGPCATMNQLVFSAKDVAAVADGLVCIKIDGDEHKALAERHQVKGYPTGILFGADGKEIARYSGYQSVKQMAEFFKKR